MKKLIPVLLVAYISIIGGLNCASAQNVNSGLKFENLAPDTSAEMESKSMGVAPGLPLTSVHKKALTHFGKSFEKAKPVSWWHTKEQGYVAVFYEGEVKNRIFYQKNGRWLATIREYKEEYLPKGVRRYIKSSYRNWSIFHIAEVTIDGQTVYMVTLEDSSAWKKIRLIDDEIVEDAHFSK